LNLTGSVIEHKNMKEVVIKKEDAVFWLDGNGRWHNQFGLFRNKKIIDFFHRSIRRDENGYHLYQEKDNHVEKVYFTYQDCALFVFEVVGEDDATLVLNTQRQIPLKPRRMYVQDDGLYMQAGEECIKFSERSLMKLARRIEEENDQYFIRIRNRRYRIPRVDTDRKRKNA
jgi:hypothetical protein